MIIQQDLHLHTHLSLCASPDSSVAKFATAATELGLTAIGISNHYREAGIPGGDPFYEIQNFDHISSEFAEIAAQNTPQLRILRGAEVEYSPEIGDAAISPEHASKLDYVLFTNSHTHLTMPKAYYDDRRKHAHFMLNAYLDMLNGQVADKITAVAHPFAAVCCPYDRDSLLPLISDHEYMQCFRQSAEHDIALEINTDLWSGYKTLPKLWNSEMMRIFKLARRCGCRFTFGSDAHRSSSCSSIRVGYLVAAMLELSEQDIKRI